jgi:uncharacterized protein (DUF2141 family)
MFIGYILLLLGSFFTDQTMLKVVVQNVQAGKGSVVVSLYNEEKTFLKKPIASQIQKAEAGVIVFSFTIPPGEYAVAAYQDLNDNKKLDAGMFHIPKEPYGFSNHYRPTLSAPHFEPCLITITGSTTSVIDLK